ncbi:DUF6541 family protein [Sinomonas humi]|uniref:Glycosyltransferase RgtA/B/C/D-like domain-containing protein n=1 Tax=Sinomonas humi TaxID=1338436 RepID=A0A0B2AFQ6_9MICC|nr:DUF6541 family protein [Sinomonas humi]KHL00645.1 hypothetical protein LK10_19125 [Sinomonas humi]
MSWLGAVPAIGIAVLVLVVPGLLASLAFGLRGYALVGLAPAFSMSFIAIASTLAPLVHLRWGILPLAVATLLGGLVVWALRRLLRWPLTGERLLPRWRGHRIHYAAYVLGLLFTAALIGRSLLIAFVSPDSFSQTFDNVFHLNALRYIQDTGSASSLTVGLMAGSSFYPAGWHALASLVQGLAGVPIPLAVNATNLAIGAMVWPVSVVFLVRTIFGSRPLAIFTGALLSAGFAAFPLLMIDFGVLYPNYLGLALLPACLALLLRAMRLSHAPNIPALREWLMLGAAMIGMSVAHPNSAMALLAFSIPLFILVYARHVLGVLRSSVKSRRRIVGPSVLLLVFLILSVVVWKAVRPPLSAAFWPPTQTIAQAVGEGLLGAPMRMAPTFVIVVLLVVGLFYCVRNRRMWPALITFLMGLGLYVIVSGYPAGSFRNFVTAVWYNDSYRLASLLPMVLIPVAVGGALALARAWGRAAARISGSPSNIDASTAGDTTRFPAVSASAGAALGAARRSKPQRMQIQPLLSGAGLLVLTVLLVLASQYGQVATERVNARGLYDLRGNSPLVTTDEMAILDRLDTHVPSNAVIAGSPYTGTALAYALADRKTLQLHILSPITPQIQAVDTGLRDAPANSAACTAIKDLHVQYVLDFGTQEIHHENHPYHGVEDLQGSHAVQLIDQQGAARLYKVVACQG